MGPEGWIACYVVLLLEREIRNDILSAQFINPA